MEKGADVIDLEVFDSTMKFSVRRSCHFIVYALLVVAVSSESHESDQHVIERTADQIQIESTGFDTISLERNVATGLDAEDKVFTTEAHVAIEDILEQRGHEEVAFVLTDPSEELGSSGNDVVAPSIDELKEIDILPIESEVIIGTFSTEEDQIRSNSGETQEEVASPEIESVNTEVSEIINAPEDVIEEIESIQLRLTNERVRTENIFLRAELDRLNQVEILSEQLFIAKQKENELALRAQREFYEVKIKDQSLLLQEISLLKDEAKANNATDNFDSEALRELRELHQKVQLELSEKRAELALYTTAKETIIEEIDVTAKTIVEGENINADLVSCLSTLKTSTEEIENYESKLKISKNIEVVEKLTAENCKLKSDVMMRESRTKIKALEGEAKKHQQQINALSSKRPYGKKGPSNSDMRFDRDAKFLYTLFTNSTAAIYEFLEPIYHRIVPSTENGMKGTTNAKGDNETGSVYDRFLILCSASKVKFDQLVKDFHPIYSAFILQLSGVYQQVAQVLYDSIFALVDYYHDTIFPIFHNQVVPEVVRISAAVYEVLQSFHSQAHGVLSTHVYTPVIAALYPLYQEHLEPHVTAFGVTANEFYSKHLEDSVDTYVYPAYEAFLEHIASTTTSLQALYNGIDGNDIMASAVSVASDLYSHFIESRSLCLTFLENQPVLQDAFGVYTGRIVTIFVNFIIAYAIYCIVSFLLDGFLWAIGADSKEADQTDSDRDESVTFHSRSPQKISRRDMHISVIESKEEREYSDDVRPSVSKRNRSPKSPTVAGDRPYSGLPLSSP